MVSEIKLYSAMYNVITPLSFYNYSRLNRYNKNITLKNFLRFRKPYNRSLNLFCLLVLKNVFLDVDEPI